MNNLIEDLKKYFETTPREKVLEDWAKSVNEDKIGPTIDEFLHHTRQYYQVNSRDPLTGIEISNLNFGLKFPSGFFFNKKNESYASSSFFFRKFFI